MTDYTSRREQMVEVQIVRRGVRDPHVLAAMRSVPRERFVDEKMADFAYEDSPLPIEAEQTISQPYIVAAMIEAAEVRPGDRVLEIGSGSGYAAAVLAQIAAQVFAIERHDELGELARERMRALGYDNVEVRVGDGTLGLPEAAPFDAILVSAGGSEVPRALKEQLEIDARMVIPVGETGEQKLFKVTRIAANLFEEENLGAVVFVPLIGEQGWQPMRHQSQAWRFAQPKPAGDDRRGG
jgi:protein-L-isoaspartate(D-aspartate) O-methyltransferase